MDIHLRNEEERDYLNRPGIPPLDAGKSEGSTLAYNYAPGQEPRCDQRGFQWCI